MPQSLEKIDAFIAEHHVMTLATSNGSELSACSLFYSYNTKKHSFVVASSEDTLHVKHIEKSNSVAGNILLETDKVGEIKGLQFRGEFVKLEESTLQKEYFLKFPYALAMLPQLWQIKVNYFKLTDNRLGFGKKLIWSDSFL